MKTRLSSLFKIIVRSVLRTEFTLFSLLLDSFAYFRGSFSARTMDSRSAAAEAGRRKVRACEESAGAKEKTPSLMEAKKPMARLPLLSIPFLFRLPSSALRSHWKRALAERCEPISSPRAERDLERVLQEANRKGLDDLMPLFSKRKRCLCFFFFLDLDKPLLAPPLPPSHAQERHHRSNEQKTPSLSNKNSWKSSSGRSKPRSRPAELQGARAPRSPAAPPPPARPRSRPTTRPPPKGLPRPTAAAALAARPRPLLREEEDSECTRPRRGSLLPLPPVLLSLLLLLLTTLRLRRAGRGSPPPGSPRRRRTRSPPLRSRLFLRGLRRGPCKFPPRRSRGRSRSRCSSSLGVVIFINWNSRCWYG